LFIWARAVQNVWNQASRVIFSAISLFMLVLAVGLIGYAGIRLGQAFRAPDSNVGNTLLDSVGYTIIAVAVFEVSKYIFEEEVLEPTEMRHAGEARRSMTKFISTISIAVFLEALVMIFTTSKQEHVSNMLYPTLLIFAGVSLVVGLGAYQRLSAAAEREVTDPPHEQKDPSLP
jgi:uncharacterized membrane protein YidH (DUF202 family)